MQEYEPYTGISRAATLPPESQEDPPADTQEENWEPPHRPPETEPAVEQPLRPAAFRLSRRKPNGVLALQCAVSAALLLLLLALRAFAPTWFEAARSWYTGAVNRVITVTVSSGPGEQEESSQGTTLSTAGEESAAGT